METLQKIIDSGIFAYNGSSLSREFVPFNEQLAVEYFSEELNSARLCVRDAYETFFSYVEDKELWELNLGNFIQVKQLLTKETLDLVLASLKEIPDSDYRAILPMWIDLLPDVSRKLKESDKIALINCLLNPFEKYNERNISGQKCDDYFFSRSSFIGYNPFRDNLKLACRVANTIDSQSTLQHMAKLLLDYCSRGFMNQGPIHDAVICFSEICKDSIVDEVQIFVDKNESVFCTHGCFDAYSLMVELSRLRNRTDVVQYLFKKISDNRVRRSGPSHLHLEFQAFEMLQGEESIGLNAEKHTAKEAIVRLLHVENSAPYISARYKALVKHHNLLKPTSYGV